MSPPGGSVMRFFKHNQKESRVIIGPDNVRKPVAALSYAMKGGRG